MWKRRCIRFYEMSAPCASTHMHASNCSVNWNMMHMHSKHFKPNSWNCRVLYTYILIEFSLIRIIDRCDMQYSMSATKKREKKRRKGVGSSVKRCELMDYANIQRIASLPKCMNRKICIEHFNVLLRIKCQCERCVFSIQWLVVRSLFLVGYNCCTSSWSFLSSQHLPHSFGNKISAGMRIDRIESVDRKRDRVKWILAIALNWIIIFYAHACLHVEKRFWK